MKKDDVLLCRVAKFARTLNSTAIIHNFLKVVNEFLLRRLLKASLLGAATINEI